MDKLTQERIARNDATFRDANDRIAAAAADIGFDSGAPFLCECAEPTCTELVRLGLERYAEIRANPRWFFVVPGHEAVAAGAVEVVERTGGVHVVEKLGHAGEVAERLAGDAEA